MCYLQFGCLQFNSEKPGKLRFYAKNSSKQYAIFIRTIWAKIRISCSNMKQFATVTVIGRDKTGVIARVTAFLFEQHANIEALEEQVTRCQFSMTLQASGRPADCNAASLRAGLDPSPAGSAWKSRCGLPNPTAASALPSW
jgi:predicted amino acid-binding ACT domain protein